MRKLDIARFNELATQKIDKEVINNLSINEKERLAIYLAKIEKITKEVKELIKDDILKDLDGKNKNLQNGTLTFVNNYVRESIDTEKWKKENPSQYNLILETYKKKSEVKASYKATYKEV